MLRRKEILRFYPLLNQCGYTRLFHFSYCRLVRGINSAHSRTEHLPNLREKQSIASDFHVSNSNENFYGIEGDKGVIVVEGDSCVKSEELKTKSRERNDVEKIFPASFGAIRCDYENKVKYHGQFEIEDNYVLNRKDRTAVLKLISIPLNGSENKSVSSEEIGKNCNESHHLRNVGSESMIFPQAFENSSSISENLNDGKSKEFKKNANASESFIDQYYFQDSSVKDGEFSSDEVQCSQMDNSQSNGETLSLNNFESNYKDCDSLVGDSNNESNFIEKQYFQSSVQTDVPEINASNFNNLITNISSHDSSTTEILKNYTNLDDWNFKQGFEACESFQENKHVYVTQETKQDDSIGNTFSHSACVNIISDKLNYKTNSVEESKVDCSTEDALLTNKTELKTEVQNPKISSNQTHKKLSNFKYVFSESLDKASKSSSGNFYESSDLNYKDDIKKDINIEFSQKHEQSTELSKNANEEEIKTAYEFAKKLRSKQNLLHSVIQNGRIVIPKECKHDSKGFKILENQVPDFTNSTNDEIVGLLRNSVLYSDDNLIVLNKPYNLVIHESETTKTRCLSSLLENLAKDLDPKNVSPKLFTVHRLDKETTGCLLLARTEIMAQTLKSYFAQRKIMKKYLIITSKVPEPLEGIIDIPITEGFIEKKSRMVLRPEIPSDIKYYNHCGKGKRAITQYKVLSAKHSAALVEVKPETGIKHQIRVHFGFGLSCPILGDHKYSHLTKLAPQKLQADILQKLYVRQSKVRYIPMHIHAQSITIPNYFENRNLFVGAPLPEHMKRTMKALKLNK